MDLVYIVYSQDLTDEILLPEQCFRWERFCEQIDCVLCFFFFFLLSAQVLLMKAGETEKLSLLSCFVQSMTIHDH